MADSRPPFRADHVGSLLRPPALKALRLERESGKVSAAELRTAEDAAIRDGVKLQEDAGLQGITDGEMRRKSWHMDFLLQLSGLSSEGRMLPVTFNGREGDRFFTRPDLQLPYDGFFLEFDDARSGDFSPLRHVPKHVRVVLGLVASKVGTLEKKDDLKRRLDEASKYIALEQLCVSPQCGFSSTVEGNDVTVEDERAKLSLCVELARDVWGSV